MISKYLINNVSGNSGTIEVSYSGGRTIQTSDGMTICGGKNGLWLSDYKQHSNNYKFFINFDNDEKYDELDEGCFWFSAEPYYENLVVKNTIEKDNKPDIAKNNNSQDRGGQR